MPRRLHAWSHPLDWELTRGSFTGLWTSGASACHAEPIPLFAMKLARVSRPAHSSPYWSHLLVLRGMRQIIVFRTSCLSSWPNLCLDTLDLGAYYSRTQTLAAQICLRLVQGLVASPVWLAPLASPGGNCEPNALAKQEQSLLLTFFEDFGHLRGLYTTVGFSRCRTAGSG